MYIDKVKAEAQLTKNRAKILRAAQAMHNACITVQKESHCAGCPFDVPYGGCSLNGHPIEWKSKIKEAREKA